MISGYILKFIPISLEKDFFFSLPAISQIITEAISWILVIGLCVFAVNLVRQGRGLYSIRLVNRRLRLEEWDKLDIPSRLALLLKITKSSPALYWAVERIQKLRDASAGRMIGEVVELSAMRYRTAGLFPLLPRLCIMLGLMGTLIGLTAAVQHVYLDVETMDSIDSLRSPLRAMLTGLGTAFVTTLFGVFAATALSPLLVASRWLHTRLVRELDAALTTEIVPLAAPDEQDSQHLIQEMVERISQGVMANVMNAAIRETAAGLNDLSLRLCEAVNTVSISRADAGGIWDKLDAAAEEFRHSAALAHRIFGQLDERIHLLTQSVMKLTPERETSLDAFKEAAKSMEEGLLTQWAILRRQNAEQLEAIEKINETLHQFRAAADQSALTIKEGLAPLQTQNDILLPKIQFLLQEIQRQAGEAKNWLSANAESSSAKMGELLTKRLGEIRLSADKLASLLDGRLDDLARRFGALHSGLEAQQKQNAELMLNFWEPIFPSIKRKENVGEEMAPDHEDAQQTKAMLAQLTMQSQQNLQAWRQTLSELHQTSEGMNRLIQSIEQRNRSWWKTLQAALKRKREGR
ncbi:MAG: MotA/TolQ/ExbB proton channel family protein [Candidatus Omnitrophota bacterium]